MPDASPVKWHLAHTTWFFETFVLALMLPGYAVYDRRVPRAVQLVLRNASATASARPERGLISRPDLATVFDYRAPRRPRDARALDTRRCRTDCGRADPTLGVNHEQQHQELILTDVSTCSRATRAKPAYQRTLAARRRCGASASRWHRLRRAALAPVRPRGEAALRSTTNCRRAPRVRRAVRASRRGPVTHGEFAEFIADGGYDRPELWLSLGWDAVRRSGWRAPLYWERSGRDAGGRSRCTA